MSFGGTGISYYLNCFWKFQLEVPVKSQPSRHILIHMCFLSRQHCAKRDLRHQAIGPSVRSDSNLANEFKFRPIKEGITCFFLQSGCKKKRQDQLILATRVQKIVELVLLRQSAKHGAMPVGNGSISYKLHTLCARGYAWIKCWAVNCCKRCQRSAKSSISSIDCFK